MGNRRTRKLVQNSYQKEIQRLIDDINRLKNEVEKYGHDSLSIKLGDATSELKEGWQIAGMDDERGVLDE